MNSMLQLFTFKKKYLVVFKNLVPIEIASCFPIFDRSYWLKEEVQLILDKFFREKLTVLMASTLSSCTFPKIFYFCVYFLRFHCLIVMI